MLSKTLKHWFNQFLPDEESIILLTVITLSSLVLLFFGYLLAPFLASLVIAFVIHGVVRKLKQWKLPHLPAVIIVFSCFIGILLVFLLCILPNIWEQLLNLLDEMPKIIESLEQELSRLFAKRSSPILPDVINQFSQSINQIISTSAQSLFAVSLQSLSSIFVLGLYLFIIPIFIFFLLKDSPLFIKQFTLLLPKKRRLLKKIWSEMEEKLTNYIRGKVIEMIITGTVTYICFLLLGLNFAELLAIAVGISVVIPYVGAIVVSIPVIMVAYMQWGMEPQFWWVIIAHISIQVLEGNILVPIIFSEAVNLHPIIILLSIIVFGNLWGVLGVFFAIPLATLIKVIWQAWPRYHTEHPAEKT